jgi:hypothetical protein
MGRQVERVGCLHMLRMWVQEGRVEALVREVTEKRWGWL